MAKIKRSNSHRHRRLNRYTGDTSKRRRRSSFNFWWIIPISAALAFVLALLLGNFLGSQVEDPPETTGKENAESTPSLPPAVSDSIESIDGIFVGLEGILDYTYDEVSKQIPDGTQAISLSMFYSNGTPIYKSAVAEECDKPSGELTLRNIFRYPKENGIYVSVPFPSAALSEADGPTSNITAAYEAQLIKELSDAGADEVIIKCDYETLDDKDFILRIANYISVIKLTAPKIHVGFMISPKDATLTSTIDTIYNYADFCAVDMSAAKDSEEISSFVESSLTNILRYKMRVLISGDESVLDEKYKALDSFGIDNRQVITK